MRPVSYWDYLRLEDLLGLQGGLERDEKALSNDEVLFISVHQVYELWFKLIFRELKAARDLFTADPVAEQELSGAVRSLKRVSTILRVATHHWEVMETLPTREFLAFRDKLLPASGFQSAQMRQIEILLGLLDAERAPAGLQEGWKDALRGPGGAGNAPLALVEAQLADRPTLKEAIDEWLFRTPIDGCGPLEKDAPRRLSEFVEAFLTAHAREIDATAQRATSIARNPADAESIRARYQVEKTSVRTFFAAPSDADGGPRRARIRAAMMFIETYRELPLLAWPREVLDGLVELEELFVVYRQRHARMVERVIGRRTGTGGSSGVDYLDATARYRIFGDLWAIRTLQVRRAAAPELKHPEFYGFRAS